MLNTNRLTYEAYDTNFARMRQALDTGNVEKAVHWLVLGWSPNISDPNAPTDFYGTSAEEITDFVLRTHGMALRHLKEQNEKTPGYAMLSIPTMPQLRMIRRIKGRYTMRPEDVFQPMEDTIGCVSDWRRIGPVYQVPYRCMVQQGCDNLLAVGRNIAAENDTWDIMRCYPGAMTTGQAAGVAAALALQTKQSVNDISIGQLQSLLEKNDVILRV